MLLVGQELLSPDATRQRKSVSAIALILTLFFSATALPSCVRLIYAQTESVIIRADGSVSPSTAPIQRVGDLYVLTGDEGGISVERSNITLDGRGHSIQAGDIGGISLQS